MKVPAGWKLIPIEPTLAMRAAYSQAMRDYIQNLPAEERAKFKGKRYPLREPLKMDLRWRAMLNAAPTPPAPKNDGRVYGGYQPERIPPTD